MKFSLIAESKIIFDVHYRQMSLVDTLAVTFYDFCPFLTWFNISERLLMTTGRYGFFAQKYLVTKYIEKPLDVGSTMIRSYIQFLTPSVFSTLIVALSA